MTTPGRPLEDVIREQIATWRRNGGRLLMQKFAANELEATIDAALTGSASSPTEGWQKVTRFEVIDASGRTFTAWGCAVELSYQDDGRTLKVFVSENPHAPKSPEPGWLAPVLDRVRAPRVAQKQPKRRWPPAPQHRRKANK